jgi:hypothetical protein
MGGAVPPLPQYAFMAWCSVRGSTGTTLPFTFMDVREIGCEGVDWILLAQDRDQWRATVNTFGFHKRRRISWLAEWLSASREVFFSSFRTLLKLNNKY